MSRRLSVLLLIPTFLLLGGCGASSHSRSAVGATTSGPASVTTSHPGTASVPGAQGSSGTARRGGSVPAGGATNVRVPATFTIGQGDRLSPSTISVPAFIAIQLTGVSADGRPHTVTFNGRTLHVPSGGRAGVLIPGLRAGRYPVVLDGARRGALAIGGEPGP